MASAAEQLASSINFGAFSKATELKKRIWFTLGALIIYRLGTYIPLPGIDSHALEALFAQQAGGIIGMFDMFSGGALRRMTIFALNIMPYISASIIMQLMTSISPSLEAIKKEGESGRKKINQYTRMLTVFLAAAQAFGIANGLAAMRAPSGPVVIASGPFFYITTVVSLTAGTVFLMWLGEQITQRGVGNGTSLIIFSGIVARLPAALVGTLELGRTGALELWVILLHRRGRGGGHRLHRLFRAGPAPDHRPISQAPGGQQDVRGRGLPSALEAQQLRGDSAYFRQLAPAAAGLHHRLRGRGRIPAGRSGSPSISAMARRSICSSMSALIVFFAFFYTAVVFNPQETADNLKKYGGFIPGIRPGKNTADYLDYVLTRLTVLGAAYLAVVCVLPEILLSWKALPFYFGGTSLLIVVSVTMDTVAQIHSHLLAHQYEGLIKKSKLRGRRG